jgi:DNA helicase II / ATP-dependent DNA helicase PcrA
LLVTQGVRTNHPDIKSSLQKATVEFGTELLKFACFNIANTSDLGALEKLAIKYNLQPPDNPILEEFVYQNLDAWLERGIEMALDHGLIDYTDMNYIPVRKKLVRQSFDFVFVDEAQDLSILQLQQVLMGLNPQGRALFVGDRYQAIMAFAGANNASLEVIQAVTTATVFPLSVSYRCPKSHVELAKRIAPDIQASSSAIEGGIFWIHWDKVINWAKPKHLILSRFNANLTELFFDLLEQDLNCHLKTNVERFLIDLRALPNDEKQWELKLETLERERREQAHQKTGKDDESSLTSKLEYLTDHFATLRVYVSAARRKNISSTTALEEFVAAKHKFKDPPKDAVRLCTVHGAKGLEASRVFLLEPELFTKVVCRTPEAVEAEMCVQFVALTRSTKDLVLIQTRVNIGDFVQGSMQW